MILVRLHGEFGQIVFYWKRNKSRTRLVHCSRRRCTLRCRWRPQVQPGSSSRFSPRSRRAPSPPPPPHDSHLTCSEKGGGCTWVSGDLMGHSGSFWHPWRAHAVSDTISPWTLLKPSAPAATAAAAMVFTLFGASGHSSATDPLNKTRRPSPSFQSERASPVSRKQDGCLDILTNTPWKHRGVLIQVNTDNTKELSSLVTTELHCHL